MEKLTDLERIPPRHFVPAADESAGLLIIPDPIKNFTVLVHVLHGEPVEYHHDVDIAVFACLAAHIAPLKADVQQPGTESVFTLPDQFFQITVNVKRQVAFSSPNPD